MRVPQTARRSNQSILKEINSEYALEGLKLKLKFQYFRHLIRRADSLEKTLMLETTEGKKRRRRQDKMVGWHHRFNGHEFEQTPGDSKGQGSQASCSPWGCKQTEQQQPSISAHHADLCLRVSSRPGLLPFLLPSLLYGGSLVSKSCLTLATP